MGFIRTNYKISSLEIPDDIISASHINDGAILASHLADNAVSASAINAAAVTAAKIAASAVSISLAGIGLSWVTDSFATSTSTDGTLFFSTGAGLPSMIVFQNLSGCGAGVSCGAGIIDLFGVPSIAGSVVYATAFARAYLGATFTAAYSTVSRIQWYTLIGSR